MMPRYTPAQQKALRAAFFNKGAIFAPRSCAAGGAYRRCCERLAAKGLLGDAPPFPITVPGLWALWEVSTNRFANVGCVAYLDDLRAVEAALRDVPFLARKAAPNPAWADRVLGREAA